MQSAPSQRSLAEGASPSFGAGRQRGEVAQALLGTLRHDDPQGPSRVLRDTVAQNQRPIAVRIRPLNRWRAAWQINRRQGRPRRAPDQRPVAAGAEVVHGTPRLSSVGGPLFAVWLDQQSLFGTVVKQLTQTVEAHQRAHPGDDCALRHHREQTLRRRFQGCVPPFTHGVFYRVGRLTRPTVRGDP